MPNVLVRVFRLASACEVHIMLHYTKLLFNILQSFIIIHHVCVCVSVYSLFMTYHLVRKQLFKLTSY